jgi:antitoxin MazE
MHIAKWGNSLAIRLPRKLVDDLRLKEGDEVELRPTGPDSVEIVRSTRIASALERMADRKWSVPEDYRFDREEANSR